MVNRSHWKAGPCACFLGFILGGLATGCTRTQAAPSMPEIISRWEFHPPQGWTPAGTGGLPETSRLTTAAEWRLRFPPELLSFRVTSESKTRELQAILDPFFTKYNTILVCHGLHALFGERRPPFGLTVADVVAMQQPGSIAVVSYRYPRILPPDQAAETSLRTLCPNFRSGARKPHS